MREVARWPSNSGEVVAKVELSGGGARARGEGEKSGGRCGGVQRGWPPFYRGWRGCEEAVDNE
jgi:hypothetical protein